MQMRIVLPLFRVYAEPPFDEDDVPDVELDPLDQAYADAVGPGIEELIQLTSQDEVHMLCGHLTLQLDHDSAGKILLLHLELEQSIENAAPKQHSLRFVINSSQLDRFQHALSKRAGTASMSISRTALSLGVFRMDHRRAVTATWDLERSPDVVLTLPFDFPFEDNDYERCEFRMEYHDLVDVIEMLVRRRGRMSR